jgi:hypothetical protein
MKSLGMQSIRDFTWKPKTGVIYRDKPHKRLKVIIKVENDIDRFGSFVVKNGSKEVEMRYFQNHKLTTLTVPFSACKFKRQSGRGSRRYVVSVDSVF